MSEKVEDQIKEFAGTAQQKYGELTNDYDHQAKGAVRKFAAQGSRRFRMRLTLSASRWVVIW